MQVTNHNIISIYVVDQCHQPQCHSSVISDIVLHATMCESVWEDITRAVLGGEWETGLMLILA